MESSKAFSTRYKLEGTAIGAGAFGEVFKAKDTVTGDTVAIKQMEFSNKEAALQEIMRVRKVPPHPNIVKFLEVSESTLRVVMEFCECDLLKFYRRRHIPAEESIDLALQCLRGIEYMHEKGLIHRDLKPANIMIKDGVAKITDFGLANVDAMDKNFIDSMFSMSTVVGTQYFMAPEITRRERYTNAVDIFSMGLVIEWMNAKGETNKSFSEVVELMTRRDPKMRPKAKVAREKLEALVREQHTRIVGEKNKISDTHEYEPRAKAMTYSNNNSSPDHYDEEKSEVDLDDYLDGYNASSDEEKPEFDPDVYDYEDLYYDESSDEF